MQKETVIPLGKDGDELREVDHKGVQQAEKENSHDRVADVLAVEDRHAEREGHD